eukprot:EG_transcript_59405
MSPNAAPTCLSFQHGIAVRLTFQKPGIIRRVTHHPPKVLSLWESNHENRRLTTRHRVPDPRGTWFRPSVNAMRPEAQEWPAYQSKWRYTGNQGSFGEGLA